MLASLDEDYHATARLCAFRLAIREDVRLSDIHRSVFGSKIVRVIRTLTDAKFVKDSLL